MRISQKNLQVSCIWAAMLLIPVSALGLSDTARYSDGSGAAGAKVVWCVASGASGASTRDANASVLEHTRDRLRLAHRDGQPNSRS